VTYPTVECGKRQRARRDGRVIGDWCAARPTRPSNRPMR
jgi:hypothetical protein